MRPLGRASRNIPDARQPCRLDTGRKTKRRPPGAPCRIEAAKQGFATASTSFFNRELRALRDVDITDASPNYKVSIVAIAVKLRSGYSAGNAVSVLITSPVGDWTWALSNTLGPDTKKSVADLLAKQYSLDDHRLLVGGIDELQQQITQLVADFDANTLEPSRRFQQQMRNLGEKKK